MKVDHVTYQVSAGQLRQPEIEDFFVDLLGMKEIEPDEKVEGKGWTVRWFEDAAGFVLHLVEAEEGADGFVDLKLGHFCAVIDRGAYSRALESEYRESIGSLEGRAWLKGPGGIRVEIRPKPLRLPHPGEKGGGSLDRLESLAPHEISCRCDRGGDFNWQNHDDDCPRRQVIEMFRSMDWELPEALRAIRPATKKQEEVLMRALKIYEERNEKYKDNWRRFGWRGCIFRMRERVERAWDALWDHEIPDATDATINPADASIDDLLDLINFAAFTIRAIEEGNRDGSWFAEVN